MTTEELYAAGKAAELPKCGECNGTRHGDYIGAGLHLPCRPCQGTGRKGGDEAIKLHNYHKAELEHHMAGCLFWRGDTTYKSAAPQDVIDAMTEYHAAAIRRIAGYLEVE